MEGKGVLTRAWLGAWVWIWARTRVCVVDEGVSVGVVIGLGVDMVEAQGQGHGQVCGQGQASTWGLVLPRALMGVDKGLAGCVG